MSSKKKKSSSGAAHADSREREQKRQNKAGSISGVVIGLIAALILFSFSNGGKNATKKWVEGTGTVVEAHTVAEAKGTAYYADIRFTDAAGEERTVRSTRLESDLAADVGRQVKIKHAPDGSGVLVVGNEYEKSLTVPQIIFIVAAIVAILKISSVIKNKLPTPEEYAERRKKA